MARTYLSIDLETTGLDPKNCEIIEYAAILFDPFDPEWNKNTLSTQGLVDTGNSIAGEINGIHMNAGIIEELAAGTRAKVLPEFIGTRLNMLCRDAEVSKVTIIGKNFDAFDSRFLEKHGGTSWEYFRDTFTHRRTLDLGSVFWGIGSMCDRVPSQKEIKAFVEGTPEPECPHRAFADAWDVCALTSWMIQTMHEPKTGVEG